MTRADELIAELDAPIADAIELPRWPIPSPPERVSDLVVHMPAAAAALRWQVLVTLVARTERSWWRARRVIGSTPPDAALAPVLAELPLLPSVTSAIAAARAAYLGFAALLADMPLSAIGERAVDALGKGGDLETLVATALLDHAANLCALASGTHSSRSSLLRMEAAIGELTLRFDGIDDAAHDRLALLRARARAQGLELAAVRLGVVLTAERYLALTTSLLEREAPSRELAPPLARQAMMRAASEVASWSSDVERLDDVDLARRVHFAY